MSEPTETKVYVVVERGWEHNDEYYFRSESGSETGGFPSGVYLSADKAQDCADEENIAQFLTLSRDSRGTYSDSLKDIHRACIDGAREYAYPDSEEWYEGIMALNAGDPSLFTQIPEDDDGDDIPELTRELTAQEIIGFMIDTRIGDSYVHPTMMYR